MALIGAQFVNAVSPNPVGSLQAYAGPNAPTGWLLCDGSSYSTTAYPELYDAIGYTYGGSAGTFYVPDLRGRVPMGAGTGAQQGGSGSGVISGGTALTARSLGQFGGDERLHQHTHVQNSHNHSQNGHYHGGISYAGSGGGPPGPHASWTVGGASSGAAATFGNTGQTTATNIATTATNQNTGSGQSENMPPFVVTNYIIKAQSDAPRSGLAYGSTPPIVTQLPSNPQFGEEVVYKHSANGNIGSHLPMIYDGTKWQPVGEAVLCRWNCGSASQVFSSTSVTNVTVGDYGSLTFTPPWDGYYEISQKTGMWELNSGIGMQTSFSATDGSAHYSLHYIQDWNGPYQHHREGHGMPINYYLYSAKTYRFTANITYAAGNTGTINFYGTAHVRALSR